MPPDPGPLDLARAPSPADLDAGVERWAYGRARRLLRDTVLVCDGQPHRIREVELYLRCEAHPDPFVHGHPLQARVGWYFHRVGRSYRGGTFKGLDYCTGGPGMPCGWLLRGIETADGRLIDGSCNVVDHLLALAGEADIAPLDAASAAALDPRSRLHLRPAEALAERVWRTPRVGLTLKRAAAHRSMVHYIGHRLRFLTTPRRTKKGRVQLLAALLDAGHPPQEIRRLTGSPLRAIRRAATAFEAGHGADPARWIGRSLSSADLYALYGSVMAGDTADAMNSID